jgi:hypothetical protein
VKQAFDKVCKEILEVPMEVDTPLEDHVENINESIQSFYIKNCLFRNTNDTKNTSRRKRPKGENNKHHRGRY